MRAIFTQEEFAKKWIARFPNKTNALLEHYKNYGELLGHIFFSEEISIPLYDLLKNNLDIKRIEAFCHFIEEMWRCGTQEVINIVDVTILERLSDDNDVWGNFGTYVTQEFRDYINNDVLIHNCMMFHVHKL